ncbi:hypothetical protein EYC84_006801 [Monilinia fructicola]|uniref:inorganic diphosphatase n=1 Tax=Monilinia fructicola TaxID=38448 RepID=A0A5M9K9F9_MONFR|nr:hypothetical protein EYC84_006801 [Monilinia fructicola]
MFKLRFNGIPNPIWKSRSSISISTTGTTTTTAPATTTAIPCQGQSRTRSFTQLLVSSNSSCNHQLKRQQLPLRLPLLPYNKGVTATQAKLANKNNPTIPLRVVQISRHLSTNSSSENQTPSNTTTMASKYTVRKIGAPNTLEHRIYIEKDGVPVSPFHDIPLYANEQQTILNMVVEIPRWTNGKLEISKEEMLNPIEYVKKGKLRFVRNCFPHKGYLWNYGAFPQTWEDPNVIHPETKAKGDNDPLDVCEIGELVGYPGQVKQVKVLGVMALLDEEETDWKVIVIDVNDPLAPKLNDTESQRTNSLFTGECKNKKYATDIVRECAEAWEKLITGKTTPGDVSTTNVTVKHSNSRVDPSQLPPIPSNENLAPAPIDPSIDKWFFISGAAA